MARRIDDPVALTAALASELLVSWAPDNLDRRLALDDELVSVAATNGIAYAELIGRHFRMVDHLESGDRAAADADFAACQLLAERLGHYAFHVQLAWYRSMLAFVEGRLDDAEQLVHDAFQRNLASNEPAAWTAYGAQMFRLRREQGRHAELEATLRASAELQPHLAGALLTGVATIAAEHGRTDEAREVLDAVLASGPFADGNDLMIPLHAAQIAEAAVAVGHDAGGRARRPRARHARGRSRPARDRATCASVPSTARAATSPGRSGGSTTRSSATNARSTSRKPSARGSTPTAHGSGSRTRSPPRDADGDRERVEFLAPAVVRVAEELGTPMVADSARAPLADASESPRSTPEFAPETRRC